jgi:hypothetical protein
MENPPDAQPPPTKSPRPIPEKALAAARKMRYRPSWARPYASGRTRAIFFKIFCLATVAGCLAQGLAFLLAGRVANVPLDNPERIAPIQALALLFAWLSWLLTLVCQLTAFVLFLVWLHRAYRNLYGLGVRSFGDSPAWAVGSFFIPLVNFYLPYRITADIWVNSRPGQDPTKRPKGTPLVLAWWIAWTLAAILSTAVSFALDRATPEQPFRDADYIALSCFLRLAAFLLMFFVVRAIQDMQDRKWAEVQAAEAAAAATVAAQGAGAP